MASSNFSLEESLKLSCW